MLQCKTSYPYLANNENAGDKIADVIEMAESGDVGKTVGQPIVVKPVGQIGAPTHFSFLKTER